MARPDGFTQILEFRPGMRRLIEDAIESLILLLDEIDGDDELEDEGDFEDGHDAEPDADAEEDDSAEADVRDVAVVAIW